MNMNANHSNHGNTMPDLFDMKHDMGGMNSNGSHGMMFFHTGYSEFILFKELKTTSVGEMVGACIVVFIMATLYEGLKVLRELLLRKSTVKTRYHSMSIEPNSSRDAMIVETHKTVGVQILSWHHFIQTLLHILQITVSYCLMLIFMTYNIWLCIAIILGAGAGYFAFGWKRAIVVDINEHCH